MLLDNKPKVATIGSSHTRIIAFLFDLGFFFILARMTLLPWFYPLNWDQATFSQIIKLNISYYGYFLGGFCLIKDIINGQSFGKWLLRIRIVKIEEHLPRPSFATCIIRNLPLVIFPAEIFFLLFDKLHRRLGDKLAGTTVITLKENFAVRNLTHRVLAIIFAGTVFWGGYNLSTPALIAKSSFFIEAQAYLAKNYIKYNLVPDYIIGYNKELFQQDDRVSLVLNIYQDQLKLKAEFNYTHSNDENKWSIDQVNIKNSGK